MKHTSNLRHIIYRSHILSYTIGMLLVLSVLSSVWEKTAEAAKIAFTSYRDGNSEIYTMNPDGSEQINLSRNDAEDWDPVWSPNGEQILFVSDRNGTSDLYLMDVGSRRVWKVFGNREYRIDPTWSPDGKKIAYVQGEEPNQAIYIATINGRSVEKLTDGFIPRWSPDGREIAFVVGGIQHALLGVFNPRTHTKRILLRNKMPWVVYPTWSPRGDKIAFSEIDGSFQQGFLSWTRAHLYTVNSDGTGLHQITKDEAGVAMEPTWSPQGDALIYTDAIIRPGELSVQLFKTDIHDHNPIQLTHDGDNREADWFDPTAFDVSPSKQLLTTLWGSIKAD